jgi:hypothetical protein
MARQFQWLSADGSQLIDLTDRGAGYRLQAEATTGLTAPPYRFTTDTHAGIDGVKVQAVSAGARELVLGLLVEGPDRDAFRRRVAALVRAMRPKAGPGTLIVTDENGQVRRLPCFYTGGAEGNEARGAKLADRWWKTTLHLLAPDPWWQGEAQPISFGLGAPTTFFPIFPLRLSASTVQGMFEVDLSDTDAPTYPQWTIIGPGSSLLLENQTTGRRIQVNASLAEGESMVIDTRPGSQSVRRGDGTNLMASLASDPALWPLIEDVNRVSAQLVGAGPNSRIHGAFRPRYAGI